MNKHEFINDPHVADFTKWMQAELKGTGRELNRWRAGSNRVAPSKGHEMHFWSLHDGFSQFHWKAVDAAGNEFSNFEQTETLLKRLQNQLNESLQNNNIKACVEACDDILRWGGVYHKVTIAAEIRALGQRNTHELLQHLNALKDWLDSDPEPATPLTSGGAVYVDSGTTKIYSLLSPSWVIYDGRVGTALGLLVNWWARDREIKPADIPALLRFSHGREAKRNSNFQSRRIFPIMDNIHLRLTHNLYANWLLAEVLKADDVGSFTAIHPDARLRALEASLFMIGYSVAEIRQSWSA